VHASPPSGTKEEIRKAADRTRKSIVENIIALWGSQEEGRHSGENRLAKIEAKRQTHEQK